MHVIPGEIRTNYLRGLCSCIGPDKTKDKICLLSNLHVHSVIDWMAVDLPRKVLPTTHELLDTVSSESLVVSDLLLEF